MVSLAAFAQRIQRRGRQIEINVDKAVAQTAIVIDQTVVSSTPVDTGRARANWQASIDTPITEPTEAEDQSGADTISRNNAVIKRRKSGQTVYISNNVAYIEALNNGSSAQAPANFVQLAVQAGISFLRRRRIVK